ncbi:MAG TPA: M28 family metallopeptidase [Nocardioidaceae bacterium]|nr:M28 family metallopeptidase [Nocardioidaceae bacterium]
MLRPTVSCALLCVLLGLSACDAGSEATPPAGPSVSVPPSSSSASPGSPTASAVSSPSAARTTPTPRPRPAPVRVSTAVRTVRHLAGSIGPRSSTSRSYRTAAAWTTERFRDLGYRVRRQVFAVPGGDSWGVPVEAGWSANLVATSSERPQRRPHLVVGAHLDTVPQAPGAEDNASGVGVLLAVAESVAGARTRLPVVFVAFGAEEPRGPTDDDHHYGSRHYVSTLSVEQRRNLRGMVSLDRVGVGRVLPICGAAGQEDRLREALLRAARRAGVAAQRCPQNRSSDHWSFVRAGLPGVRLGSTPYAGYHSPADVPSVVDRAQLARAGRTVLAWLSAP